MSKNVYEICRFQWRIKQDRKEDHDHDYVLYECIRRKGHFGSHVSYPSGEEHDGESEER